MTILAAAISLPKTLFKLKRHEGGRRVCETRSGRLVRTWAIEDGIRGAAFKNIGFNEVRRGKRETVEWLSLTSPNRGQDPTL